jgi:uridine kinase
MTNLLKPVMISLDNYFVNREQTPRDEDGDYDYESLYALDLKQFNADLNDILQGKEVALPTYSFELGERIYKGNTVRLDEHSILLIEGIHGLNPELTADIPEEQKFRIYVSALTTLSIDDHNWVPTTDNRLLRRIIRDYKYRGTDAVETIRRWPSVRRGEERWIFPYQENADATFNSSLLFELGVMKDYGEDILRRVPSNCPEYATAYRLRKFLSYFRSVPTKAVPPTSLLREFLGGSSFHY